MLRIPEGLRNLSVTTLAVRSASVALLGLGVASAQDFGSHTLPAEIADPGIKVQRVMNKAPNGGRDLRYSEGPVVDADGNLYFTEDNQGNQTGNIWKVTSGGQTSNFYSGAGLPNGLEFDNNGKMFSAEKGTVATYDIKVGGASRTTLSMNPALDATHRVNDVSIGSNGGVWFTNHANGHQYFYRDPSGAVKTYDNKAPLGVFVPNGIEWIEEKKILLVCSSDSSKVWQFDLSSDFTPSNRKLFANVTIPDGLTVDVNGNVYVASYGAGKVFVFAPTGGTGGVIGKALGEIDLKAGGVTNVSNCVFGGPGNKTLFMTGTAGAYKIQLKIAGRTRPGATPIRIRTGALRPSMTLAAGYTIAGRKLDLVSKTPATLKILVAPQVP